MEVEGQMNALTDMDVTNARVVWNDHRPATPAFPTSMWVRKCIEQYSATAAAISSSPQCRLIGQIRPHSLVHKYTLPEA
jgi:hypothetical protein